MILRNRRFPLEWTSTLVWAPGSTRPIRQKSGVVAARGLCKRRQGCSNASAGSAFFRELQEPSGELGSLPFILVFEEDVRFLPLLLAHLLDPVAQLGVGVLRQAQAKITPIGRGDKRHYQIALGLGDAQRRLAF